MKLKKILGLVLSACFLLGFLAGCGGSTSSPGGSKTSVKDTLVVTQSEEPTSFIIADPKRAVTNTKDAIIVFNIYDQLYRMFGDGSVKPWLGEITSVSNDGLVYTVKLKDNVYFHNGYKMTADDVVFSFSTLIKQNPSEVTNSFGFLTKVEKVDEYTVHMIVSKPTAAFASNLSSRFASIMSKKYYEEVGPDKYNEAPIGTGAYKFDSRISGQSITLVANEKYWNGVPSIKKVTVRPISNISSQFLSLENGEVDAILAAEAASCLQIKNKNITWGYSPAGTRVTIQFYAKEPSPLADINLRRAIQCAINKDDVIKGAIEGYGVKMDYDAVPSWNDAPDPSAVSPIVKYDVAKAKEYLAKSSYKGQPIVVVAIAGTSQEKAMQIIQGQLLAIGINMQVKPVDSSTRLTLARSAEGIDGQCYVFGAQTNDINFMNFPHSRRANYVDWAEKSFMDKTTKLIENIRGELDSAKRKALAAELCSISNEAATVVPLFSPYTIAAWNTGLKGVKPHPVGIVYYFADWSW